MVIDDDVLETLFNPTKPVGPIEAPSISTDYNLLRASFDEHNELFRALNHGNTLIIGRKGSGKTSFLNSAVFEERDNIVIALDSSETAGVFSRVVDEIDGLSRDVALVEQVANLWEVLLWGVALQRINALYPNADISKFLDGLNILGYEGVPYEIISRQIDTIKSFPPAERPVPQKVRYTKLNGISFLEAKNAALTILQSKDISCFILMDSLESYELHRLTNEVAIAGLLRCIGIFTAERTKCVLRCCVPAEKYHHLLSISQNPIKDFQGSLLLHWDAGDLIRLSAKRYATYLLHYEPALYRKLTEKLDLEKRADCITFWNKIFPTTLINRDGKSERPLAYIMRHTQLLPRHFLLLLTEIIGRSIKVDGICAPISERHIVDGVFEQEHKIKAQILEAYRSPLGHAEAACKQLLPQLRTRFSWKDFDIVASRRKGALRALDPAEILEVLIEIGAVGRYIGETAMYAVALFEYMVPNQLVASMRDSFCVHPLFTENYHVNSKYPDAKPIYTYWSEEIPPELS